MNRFSLLLIVVLFFLLAGCTASRKPFNPGKAYAPATLKKDYRLFRNILEEYHPSLYWFTPKDSLDYFFDRGYAQLTDSMNELQFRNILQEVITKIRCGHTSVRYSRAYSNYLDTAKIPMFPLSIKVWPDKMAVLGNTNRRDSLLRRGTIIRSINGLTVHQFTDTFFNYLVTDAWSVNGKYQALSAGGNFGVLYRNLFGLPQTFRVEYEDAAGQNRVTTIPVFIPVRDTSHTRPTPGKNKEKNQPPRQARVNPIRNIQIDTSLSSAYMTLNTFSRGNHLRSFFKKTFRTLDKHNIKHLVIDVRNNGGGDAGLSTLLTRFIANKKFKLADSLYALRRSGDYNKYIKKHLLYRIGMFLVTKKKKDGYYHFTHFEKKYYRPRRNHHFDGSVYIITSGNSFSATCLFAKKLQGQSNVLIVGEETGGGNYGNTAWMIPDAELPNTHLRFRLPLFRLVMDADSVVHAGRGIIPDLIVSPSAETIRKGIDPRAQTILEIIRQRNAAAKP